MKKRVILSVGLATAILTGCGSSDGGGVATGIGYYIDSAVSGVYYVCGSKSDKTGADGSFTFEVGKDCTFSLGDMKLREVKADKLKDQIKILEDNLAVATLLQTLDSDGDPDNDGITISAKMLEKFKAEGITTLPTNQDQVAAIYEIIKNVEGYDGKLKSEATAQTHLAKAQGVQLRELLGGKTFYAVDVKNNEINTVPINANVTTFKNYNVTTNGNKIIFSNDYYTEFKSKTADYLIMMDNGSEVRRLYFNKAKAEAYLDSLGSGSVPDTNSLIALLAGKTFWEVDSSTNNTGLNSVVFNSAFTSIVITEATGDSIGETETINISYSAGKINFSGGRYTEFGSKTANYIDLADSDGETTRLYFERAKAEAEMGGSDDPTPNYLITVLNGKTWGEYRTGPSAPTAPQSCYIFNGELLTAYFDGDNTQSLQLTYTLNDNVIQYSSNGQIISSTDTFSVLNNVQLNVNKVWADDEANVVWRVTPNCINMMQ